MSFGILRDLISTSFGEFKNTYKSNDQVQVNCPHCAKLYNNYEPDGKFNLEINLKKRVYKCWKCEISGPIPKLLKYYAKKDIYTTYIENFDDIDYKIVNNDDDEDIYREVILPKDFIPFSKMDKDLPSHLEAYNYMVNTRLISEKLLYEYNIGFCVDGYYKNRIVMPSYDKNGKLNYFICRTYIDDKVTYVKPKVNQDIIFNENRLDWGSTVYVVEGGFDYISIPINTLCLLGKEFIPYVFEKIIEYKPNLVFILDRDAMRQTIKYINMFNNLSIDNIKFLELPENYDIDKLRREIGVNKLSKYLLNNVKILNEDEMLRYV